MAASLATPSDAALPAERFFRTSLSLLILTSTVTLVSTGELDVFTSFAAPLIVLYKGFRWWHGRPAELSHRAATFCVIVRKFGGASVPPAKTLEIGRAHV